jgi:hypothetical protein
MQRETAFSDYGQRGVRASGAALVVVQWLVVLPHVAEISKVSEGRAVSFEAPAVQTPGGAV